MPRTLLESRCSQGGATLPRTAEVGADARWGGGRFSAGSRAGIGAVADQRDGSFPAGARESIGLRAPVVRVASLQWFSARA